MKLMLFDLGGVVVDWNGIAELAALSAVTPAEAAERFASSDICTAYEKGQIDEAVFIDHMIALYDLPFSTSQFRLQWRLWVGEAFDGVIDTIKGFRGSIKTACLSNTNDMHWKHLTAYVPVEAMFDHVFASHQIGAVKPNADAFQIVMNETGVAAADIIFFDDSAVNIAAAKELGITAYKVDPAQGVMPTLRALLTA